MLITIDERDPRPIYLQIAAAIKEQISAGALREGDELPSVRELAGTLGVNLHTVRHAYLALREQGIIRMRLAQRARVLQPPKRPVGEERIERILVPRVNELITDAFHLGLSPAGFRRLVDDLLRAKKNERMQR